MDSIGLRCVIMRGGTSKALFLRESDLPKELDERNRIILALFGSPDKRQIDGLGGADPLTSKLAIIGPPLSSHADITFTFAQVGITDPIVDFHSLCGNISSAVGHYAVYEGLVPIEEPVTLVRVYNSNLQRVLRVEVPVREGKPVEAGEYVIPGVPGSGARIYLDLAETAGGATGNLLPTGSPIDLLDVPGLGQIQASLLDIGNAHVFVRAKDLGLKGTESPFEIDADSKLTNLLENIRAAGAYKMGMIDDPEQAREKSPATPILVIVAPPATYKASFSGQLITKEQMDLTARLMFMQITHKTYAGTSTACTGVAARIKRTVVQEMLSDFVDNVTLRIGHPDGVIETESIVEQTFSKYQVHRATLGRTARRLMEGYAFVPLSAHN